MQQEVEVSCHSESFDGLQSGLAGVGLGFSVNGGVNHGGAFLSVWFRDDYRCYYEVCMAWNWMISHNGMFSTLVFIVVTNVYLFV